jgi:hypothetical protein
MNGIAREGKVNDLTTSEMVNKFRSAEWRGCSAGYVHREPAKSKTGRWRGRGGQECLPHTSAPHGGLAETRASTYLATYLGQRPCAYLWRKPIPGRCRLEVCAYRPGVPSGRPHCCADRFSMRRAV